MVSDEKNPESPASSFPIATSAFDKRLIFMSHAVADRKLADALRSAVETAFSGLVQLYASSDVSPAGGLQPGDEWFKAIHERLLRSEAVWVLATPASIKHPWLYWEAGIGRAVCPNGIVVLRLGLPVEQLPSPLNAYQAYDAEGVGGPDGLDTMFQKVANGIGMKLPEPLMHAVVEGLRRAVADYKPDQPSEDVQGLEPEQIGRFAGLLSRLEAVAQRVESETDVDRSELALGRPLLSRAERRRRFREYEELAQSPGSEAPIFVDSLENLRKFIRPLADISYSAPVVLNEGNVPVVITTEGGLQYNLSLDREWLKGLDPQTLEHPLRAFVEGVQLSLNSR